MEGSTTLPTVSDSSPPETSDSSLEYLKALYFDATNTIRHYDAQRAAFTTIFGSLLSLLASVVTAATLQGVAGKLIPAGAGLATILSVMSLLAVLKYSALIHLQRKRAAIAMARYQSAAADVDLMTINQQAKGAVRKHFGSRFDLSVVWAGIFVLLTLTNFIIFCFTLSSLTN